MAARCLGSLQRFSAEPIDLLVHDDGTLTAEDADRLASELAGAGVVWRSEADERVDERLAAHPACRAFRRSNPLGLKLLDIMLLEDGDALFYCDSDVLVLRPFRRLFEQDATAVFMADVQSAYSLRSWQLAAAPRLRLASKVNTGLIRFARAAWDLDLIEWFLARPSYFRRTPVWAEQTAWALLGGRADCRLLEPSQVRFPPPDPSQAVGAVALHFISPLRALLPAYLQTIAVEASVPPVSVVSLPSTTCGPLRLAASELRRYWARL